MNAATQALDLDNYAGIARRMYPGSQCLMLCDENGQLLRTSDDSGAERLGRLAALSPDWHTRGQGLERVELGDDRCILIMSLAGEESFDAHFLLWWVQAMPPGTVNADLHDTLMSLGVCVRNELQLQTELDHMALELSERYEELNLVYHTDDQVSYFREGHEAFRALVQNCADYLGAGLAVLSLREKDVMVASRSGFDSTDLRLIESVLGNLLYDRVVSRQDVAFLNNEDAVQDIESAPVPYRLMAGPIISFGDEPDGVLLIANLPSARPFSNSDKNLLSVMARKAAKIIQGSYDGLTGLLNRNSYEHLVSSKLEGLQGTGGHHCLMHINIDKLHRVNETVGHEAGDQVIRRVAEIISHELRDTDVVARLGGDEIGVLIHGCNGPKGAAIAGQLVKAVAALALNWQGKEQKITASAGVAALNANARSGDHVIKQCVMACDLAKEAGGNDVRLYEQDEASLKEREASMWMVSTVHTALREHHFLLYGQPILPLKPDGRPHIEILLRMRNEGKVLSPHAFLPASERYQLMVDIDRWVLEQSLVEIALHLDSGPAENPVFGINLSGQSFCHPEFLPFALKALDRSGVPPELICFEITETAAVSNLAQATAFIGALREWGCQFALDDFGAGLSSFGYLKAFDVQYLKIDGALVKDIVEDPVSAAMVESVHQIGHVMGLQTIAEYVETAAARALLERIGVDYIQGYLVGKPAPLLEQLAGMARAGAVAGL